MNKVDFTTVQDPTAECYEPTGKKTGKTNTIIGITILIIVSGGIIYELQKAQQRKKAPAAGL